MKIGRQSVKQLQARREQAMTLIETLAAFCISGVAVAGIVSGYTFSLNSAERFSLSLAANMQASERMEQVRCAMWNSTSSPVIDQVVTTNFPDEVVTLDLSGSGTGVTYATNFTTISVISTAPPLKRIRVDCVWLFGNSLLMTNTIETCRAPDQ